MMKLAKRLMAALLAVTVVAASAPAEAAVIDRYSLIQGGNGHLTSTVTIDGEEYTIDRKLDNCVPTITINGTDRADHKVEYGASMIIYDGLLYMTELLGDLWVYHPKYPYSWLVLRYDEAQTSRAITNRKVAWAKNGTVVSTQATLVDGEFESSFTGASSFMLRFSDGTKREKDLPDRKTVEKIFYEIEDPEPTVAPTVAPTVEPTKEPTPVPTVAPTVAPTSAPTKEPTLAPAPVVTQAPVPTLPQVLPTVEPLPVLTMAPAPEQTLTPALPQATPNMVIDTSFEARWQEMFNIYAQWYEQYQQATSWQWYAQMAGIANWKEVEQRYWHEEIRETTAPDGSKVTTKDGYEIGNTEGQANASAQAAGGGTSLTVGEVAGSLAATGSAAGSVEGSIHTEVKGTNQVTKASKKAKITWWVKRPHKANKKGIKDVRLCFKKSGAEGIRCHLYHNVRKSKINFEGNPYIKVAEVGYVHKSNQVLILKKDGTIIISKRGKNKSAHVWKDRVLKAKAKKLNTTKDGRYKSFTDKNGKKHALTGMKAIKVK